MDDFGAIQCLFMYLKDLGLDAPSEPAHAAMTAFRVLARGGTEAMNPGQYRQAYEYVKDVWKMSTKSRKAESASVEFIKALPVDPLEFKLHQPSIWKKLFGDGGPATPRFDQQRLQETMGLIQMRGAEGKRGAAQPKESPGAKRLQHGLSGQLGAEDTQASTVDMFGQLLQMFHMMHGARWQCGDGCRSSANRQQWGQALHR